MADGTRIMASRGSSTRREARRKEATSGARIPSLVHEAQVTTLINLAARLTNRAARIRMGRIGAWPGQIPLLLWLLEEEGVIQKDLVERSQMEQSTVGEHLDRMERDGFIYRERSREDRRKYRFYLSAKARRAAASLIRDLETGAQTFTRGIAKQDLAIFMSVIRQIIRRLEDYVRTASRRRTAARTRATPGRMKPVRRSSNRP
jgi:MarR family transcriptional regulator for hemolysin